MEERFIGLQEEVVKNIRMIYEHLQDDYSRDIFENRLLYALTGDRKFIDKILLNLPQRKQLDRAIEKCKEHIDNLVVWGTGHDLVVLSRLYPDFKIPLFCDIDEKKQREGYNGIPVLSPDELIQDKKNVYVAVNTANYHKEIVDYLLNNEFEKEKIIDLGNISQELYNGQYFDLDIMESRKEEVFIDGGCFDCGTDMLFTEWCHGQYKKIYAFEPDFNNYNKCLKKSKENNIENFVILNKGLWDSATTLSFNAKGTGASKVVEEEDVETVTIGTVSIDEIVGEEKVSLIKLDVEGAELKALQGAEKTIKRDKPRLAICIYHKVEDVVELLEYILKLNREYKLYIRHYHYENIETVVYAI